MGQTSDIPVKFVDSNVKKKHIILLYEDSEYARLIEFRFLKKGLDMGEQCMYATEKDSGSIVLKMLSYGISFEAFQTKRMQVRQMHARIGDRETILNSCKKDISLILEDLHSPFRIVSRMVPNIDEIEAMSAELELEQQYHNAFEKFGGSLMCPYDISKIAQTHKKEWLSKLRQNHHVMIYAPKFGAGSVVSLD